MDVQVVEVAPGVWHARAKHVGWALITDGRAVTIVDTGFPGDQGRLLASLDRIGRSPADVAAVVLTHGHPDHLGGAEYLRTSAGLRIWAHEREIPNATGRRVEQIRIATTLSMAWRPSVFLWSMDLLRLRAVRPRRLGDVSAFTEGVLDIPGRPLAVFTPGHTSGHCAFHLPDRGVLFVGDALMTEHAIVGSGGPRLLPGCFGLDSAQALASLERLRGLDADVVVPGHGPAFRGSPDDAVNAALAVAARTR